MDSTYMFIAGFSTAAALDCALSGRWELALLNVLLAAANVTMARRAS